MKVILIIFLSFQILCAQNSTVLKVDINPEKEYQTIYSFGASDAWAAEFVGNWPDNKKNAIADLLFSSELDKNGLPKGIGLSAWRYNIGAGSSEQGIESGIKDPWRRAESFLQDDLSYNWQKQLGQQWFLQAAKKRGVNQFIAFVNSPPIQLTKNGKAHSSDGISANISKEKHIDYAVFISRVVQYFKDSLNIEFNYVSPFNEPQWEWKGNQEGSPWNNDELATVTKILDSVFNVNNIHSKIEITEAGAIDYLTAEKSKFKNRSNQIETFFNPTSSHYLGNLKSLAPKIAGHSYFTTWDIEKLKKEREKIAEKLKKYPNLEYWMTEYCVLENNEQIKGRGKDLGIQTALYVARVIHSDLTIANASSWQWWTALSPYNYKDGLIYHDKNETEGNFEDSKLLWALGNYSRFIRPDAKRVKVDFKDYNSIKNLKEGVLISAYKNKDNSIAIVIVNQTKEDVILEIDLLANYKYFTLYKTNHEMDLSPISIQNSDSFITISKSSINTILLN
jgi:hypothetical protein